MNKLQEQSLQAKDARHLTSIIDDGNAKTHEMLGELLKRNTAADSKVLLPSFGGVPPNREYYNLFVIGSEDFKNGTFSIPKTMVFIVEYIEPKVKKRFSKLRDDNVIEQILSLPSLFMSENKDYLKSYPGQKALFGRVTELVIDSNDIKIAFEANIQIIQQNITDISHSLGIIGNPGYSELNNTHWTIKQIDLIKVLTDAELLPLPPQEKQEPQQDKYHFVFTINMDGNVEPFSSATANAITEWFEEKVNDVISEMRDENLRSTFTIDIEDMRISKHKELDTHIHEKLAKNAELTEQEEYLKYGVKRVLKRDNAFNKSALEMLLSNRVVRGSLAINHPIELERYIKKVLEFRYGDLGHKIPNNRELIPLDVYLNSNGRNAKHERFVVYVKKSDVEELFGGSEIFDVCDRSVLELTNCQDEVIIRYLFFLADLDLSGFDFSKDNRMLNFTNFWIGLH